MNVADVNSVHGGDCRPILPVWNRDFPFFVNAWFPDGEIFCVHWDMYYTQSDFAK